MEVTLKKAFAPVSLLFFTSCTRLDEQAPRTLKSKNSIHRNIMTSNRETQFYPLHRSCGALEQMAHALNSIALLHWSWTQQERGQCQPQLRLSTLAEILCFPLPQQNKYLRRNSTYQNPKFNSSTRNQQIQIQPSCKKPGNPMKVAFSSPTPSDNSSTASTLQHLLCPCVRYCATKLHLCHFLAATSIEKWHSIPLLLRKTKMGTSAFLNNFFLPAYCQNWGGMMLLLKSLISLLQDSQHFMKIFPRCH